VDVCHAPGDRSGADIGEQGGDATAEEGLRDAAAHDTGADDDGGVKREGVAGGGALFVGGSRVGRRGRSSGRPRGLGEVHDGVALEGERGIGGQMEATQGDVDGAQGGGVEAASLSEDRAAGKPGDEVGDTGQVVSMEREGEARAEGELVSEGGRGFRWGEVGDETFFERGFGAVELAREDDVERAAETEQAGKADGAAPAGE
jgi:hypothetical protein